MKARPSSDLAAVTDPAWPLVSHWMQSSPFAVQSLGVSRDVGLNVLYRLQVTASSVLGALALNSGGLLADSGWFRILGGGGEGLPDLATANHLPDDPTTADGSKGFLLVGFDVLGGRFAIDAGGLGVSPGEVCYFGPDALTWEGLGGGHTEFVHAALTGGLTDTFSALRWAEWEKDTSPLSPATGLSLYPPPFTREGRDISSVSRRPTPLAELHAFYQDAASQLNPRGE
jgi:hypothetical protein